MTDNDLYDVIIIGGGLAGLSAAISLANKKYKVLLLEKESYPRHKVCGEYISMESKPFLMSLGLHIDEMHLPVINKLQVTDSYGNELCDNLPQGGFGISRYLLDATLAILAVNAGAELQTKKRVDDVAFKEDVFTVTAGNSVYKARIVCGSWGKRSNMDVRWERNFIKGKNSALNNYIGIKYHIRYPWPGNLIGLHNFANGYCGISRVEDDKCCLCYLTTAANLQQHNNDIKTLEREVLMKNPFLNEIFGKAVFLYEAPLAISQISFDKKEQVHNHVLLLGDAAGMITPLCGNGMSIAFHSAKIAVNLIDSFLSGNMARNKMENDYGAIWKHIFSRRIAVGRLVQSNFGKNRVTSFFIKSMKHLPFFRRAIIKNASGKSF